MTFQGLVMEVFEHMENNKNQNPPKQKPKPSKREDVKAIMSQFSDKYDDALKKLSES